MTFVFDIEEEAKPECKLHNVVGESTETEVLAAAVVGTTERLLTRRYIWLSPFEYLDVFCNPKQ